jgi:cytochrome c556
MTFKKIAILALAGSLALVPISQTVLAQTADEIATMTPEQLVELRQEKMVEDGRILRNAGSLDAAGAVAAAETLVDNFTLFPSLFPEGSIVGDSEALPAIWEDWADFEARFAEARGHSEAALVAAQAGDLAGFTAALDPLGRLCGGCHDKFRVDD